MELLKEVVIVTKHKKELVIQPLIERNFKMKCFVTSVVDTDELGTFSGEVTRMGSPLDAAREKCLLGMKFEKVNAAIASEGSFGPHPQIPFVQANEEIVMFVDQETKLEIFAREISLDTNARSSRIENLDHLKNSLPRSLAFLPMA